MVSFSQVREERCEDRVFYGLAGERSRLMDWPIPIPALPEAWVWWLVRLLIWWSRKPGFVTYIKLAKNSTHPLCTWLLLV